MTCSGGYGQPPAGGQGGYGQQGQQGYGQQGGQFSLSVLRDISAEGSKSSMPYLVDERFDLLKICIKLS